MLLNWVFCNRSCQLSCFALSAFRASSLQGFSAHRLKTAHTVLHLTLLQLKLPLAESQLALPELEVRRAGGVVAAGAGEAARGVVRAGAGDATRGGVRVVGKAAGNVAGSVVRASAGDSAGGVVGSAAGDGAAGGVRAGESASGGRAVAMASRSETAVVRVDTWVDFVGHVRGVGT